MCEDGSLSEGGFSGLRTTDYTDYTDHTDDANVAAGIGLSRRSRTKVDDPGSGLLPGFATGITDAGYRAFAETNFFGNLNF
jgi:hypothetical protein